MEKKKKLEIFPAWCKGCSICASFCPRGVLRIIDEKVHIENPDDCIGCGLCELRCPDYAVWLTEGE